MVTQDTLKRGTHLGHLLAGALRSNTDNTVLHVGDHKITGQQMADQISQYVQALQSVGVAQGSAVGLLSSNRPEVLLVIGAGQTQCLRRTALHPLGSAEDHAFVLRDAGVTTLIVDTVPAFLDRATELLEKVEGLEQVLTLGPAAFGTDLVALAASMPPDSLGVVEAAPDTVTSITYTGGTTGKPKGVVGTTSSLAAMTQIQLAEWEWPDRPRFLMATPLSHAGAAFFVPALMRGGEMHVVAKFDPAEVLRVIEEEQITATMLVPSMIYALLDHPDSRTRDLSSLETIYYGASAMNPVRLAEAIERFGPIFAQYYGQSECPMVITYLSKRDHVIDASDPRQADRLSSCGRPSAWLRTALLSEDGSPVEPGQPGEICVAGPTVADGYWHLPEMTAETFRDGWLHTGDIAREDQLGFWHIVDRTKDMIVTGGFNVFPREVEDVIAEHPAVAQVAVIGTPDEKWGEAVTALVVTRPGLAMFSAVVEEIQTLVKERKGSVQAPKSVIEVESIPLTALGKPDKVALRAQYWSDTERRVG